MVTDIPWFVRLVDPVARRLLRLGLPMGPNSLLTVRGRRSGQPRSAAVAVVEVDGRRWVIGSFGDVNWVRNLRAAGEGTITRGQRSQHVTGRELSTDEAASFFRDVLALYAKGLPWIGRIWVPQEILRDPSGAAESHPVFELHVQLNGPR